LPRSLIDDLRWMAREQGTTLSVVVREILEAQVWGRK